jgi:DnaK suppressor protein
MATTTNRPRGAGRARYDGLQQLLSQQDAVLRTRRQILRDGLPTWMSGVMDVEEHSLDAEEQGIGFSVLELTSRTVQGIEAAIQRLEAGEFGACFECRRQISGLRMRAVPFADLCLACQKRQDTPATRSTPGGFRWPIRGTAVAPSGRS